MGSTCTFTLLGLWKSAYQMWEQRSAELTLDRPTLLDPDAQIPWWFFVTYEWHFVSNFHNRWRDLVVPVCLTLTCRTSTCSLTRTGRLPAATEDHRPKAIRKDSSSSLVLSENSNFSCYYFSWFPPGDIKDSNIKGRSFSSTYLVR